MAPPQALPEDGTPKLLLDLGCGSGLSGEALSERGHIWVVSAGALRVCAGAVCLGFKGLRLSGQQAVCR